MKHLTAGQRYEIYALIRVGKTKTEIASVIGVHKSTITRELRRNNYLGLKSYYPSYAQRKAEERRRRRAYNFKKTIPTAVFETARRLLEEGFSPEQIVGYCRREGIRMCSHERLYQWIWEDKRMGGELHTHLRSRGRRYRKRGSLCNGTGKSMKDILSCPYEVRSRLGRNQQWETRASRKEVAKLLRL